jgi:TonB family protein
MLISLFLTLLSLVSMQQSQPQFKGGSKNLDSFLARSLIYPEFSKQNCLQGTVEVSFNLTRTGKIYTSSVTKGYGTDLDKEALRIVRLTSGKWEIPAGYDTTVFLVLPVTFALKEDPRCLRVTKDDISAAISAYRSHEGLTRAVLNYYDNKYAGKSDITQAAYIEELKAQLGYDDKYIDRVMKQASGKLKQGD